MGDQLVTVRGRKVKPLLRARPVRAIPKSTPILNPPLHCGSRFLCTAFGGISSMEAALAPRTTLFFLVESCIDKGPFWTFKTATLFGKRKEFGAGKALSCWEPIWLRRRLSVQQ